MTVTVTPVPNKINQIPDHTDADNNNHMFPFYILLMIPNIIGSLATAYRRNDYSMTVFLLLVFSVFMLCDVCMARYLSMPKNEKSSRRFYLKLTMWFLYTFISLASVYLFSYSLSSQITVVLYDVVLICNAVVLYVFIIADLVRDWKITRSQEHRTLDAGISNHGYSVLEKV